MKKFAIGCAVVLGLVLVLGGVGFYFVYDRILKPAVEMAGSMKQFGQFDKQIRNTASFSPPENGELTQAAVDRFVKVQQQVQAALGPRLADLNTKYKELDRAMAGEKREASVGEVFGGLKDLATILVDAKKAQVDALNQAGFSAKEYEWVRDQAYAAIGMVAVGLDVKKVAAEAQTGNVKSLERRERREAPDAPERNKTLVAPYEKQLKEWAPLAFFGL
jgi:hypothetical protein